MSNYPLKDHAEFITYQGTKCGLIIRCPNCGVAMSAWFRQAIGGEQVFLRPVQWDRTGETLENISLAPSFLAFGHYHSWIRSGELCVDSPFGCKTDAERVAERKAMQEAIEERKRLAK